MPILFENYYLLSLRLADVWTNCMLKGAFVLILALYLDRFFNKKVEGVKTSQFWLFTFLVLFFLPFVDFFTDSELTLSFVSDLQSRSPIQTSIIVGTLLIIWHTGMLINALHTLAIYSYWNIHVYFSPIVERKSIAWKILSDLSSDYKGYVPTLRYSSRAKVPFVCGTINPSIVLPIESIDWSEEEFTKILSHEFAHIRHKDPYKLILIHAVKTIYWMLPLAWFGVKRQVLASERACDEYVLTKGFSATQYCNTLLRFAKRGLHADYYIMPSLAGKSTLRKRMESLLKGSRASLKHRRLFNIAGCTLALSIIHIASSARVEAFEPVAVIKRTIYQAEHPDKANEIDTIPGNRVHKRKPFKKYNFYIKYLH